MFAVRVADQAKPPQISEKTAGKNRLWRQRPHVHSPVAPFSGRNLLIADNLGADVGLLFAASYSAAIHECLQSRAGSEEMHGAVRDALTVDAHAKRIR
jgi:hypothetical protein